MSTVTGLKNSAADDDLMIIKDSENQHTLTNLRLSSIMMNSVSLTGDASGIKTYTIWRDAAQAVVFGTFEVADGVNGTGGKIPDYQSIAPYNQFNMVIDDDGFAYRYISVTESSGNKPQTGGVIHANWERVNLGGLTVVHDANADYTTDNIILRDGKLFSPVHAIAGATVAVPFVEGYGVDEWYNVATGLFPYHDENETVAIDDIRRFGSKLYQASSAISGAIAPVPFTIGTADDEWRSVGSPARYRAPTTTIMQPTGYSTYIRADSLGGTYDMPDGCVYIEIEVQAAGGPSRTLATSSANFTNKCGAGGSAGSYVKIGITAEVFESNIGTLGYDVGIAGLVDQSNAGSVSDAGNAAILADSSGRLLTVRCGIRGNGGSTTTASVIIAGAAAPALDDYDTSSFAGGEFVVLDSLQGGRASGTVVARGSSNGFIQSGRGGDSKLGRSCGVINAVTGAANGAGTYLASPLMGTGFGFGGMGRVYTGPSTSIYYGSAGGPPLIRITEYYQ